MSKKIFVYIDLEERPILVGKLWTHTRNRHESATFEYANTWLDFEKRFSLEPALLLNIGPHHTLPEKPLFGSIGDSAPDRWGRILMRRSERLIAERENRSPRAFMQIDYLLMVNDEAREGAVRFSLEEGEEFLANKDHKKIPPLIDLPKLLNTSERVTEDNASEEDLKLLLAPGSSLGGARPKASVRDKGGHLVDCFSNFDRFLPLPVLGERGGVRGLRSRDPHPNPLPQVGEGIGSLSQSVRIKLKRY